MARRSILIVYDKNDWHLDNAQYGALHQQRYRIWGEICRKKKIDFLRSSLQWFNKGTFKKHWRFMGGTVWEKVRKSVRPTVVWDGLPSNDLKTGVAVPDFYWKATKVSRYLPMVNIPELTILLDNKLNQAVIFGEWMTRSRMWRPGEVLKNPQGKNIVLKKMGGLGGQQVIITQQKRINIHDIRVQQDFITATKGGILKDIRVCFVGDKPQYVYQRVAQAGSLYTNVKQGASMEWLKLSDIPQILKICKEIMKPLQVFPKRHCSLDFLVDARTGRPFLVETNSTPGTANFSDALLERYLSNLTDHILEGL
jgi:hypothetical protein